MQSVRIKKPVAHSSRLSSISSLLDAGECLELIAIAEAVGFALAGVLTSWEANGDTHDPQQQTNHVR